MAFFKLKTVFDWRTKLCYVLQYKKDKRGGFSLGISVRGLIVYEVGLSYFSLSNSVIKDKKNYKQAFSTPPPTTIPQNLLIQT